MATTSVQKYGGLEQSLTQAAKAVGGYEPLARKAIQSYIAARRNDAPAHAALSAAAGLDGTAEQVKALEAETLTVIVGRMGAFRRRYEYSPSGTHEGALRAVKNDFSYLIGDLVAQSEFADKPSVRAGVVYPVIIGELAEWTRKDYPVPAVIQNNLGAVESFKRMREMSRKVLTILAWASLGVLEKREENPELRGMIGKMGDSFLLKPEVEMIMEMLRT